MESLDTVLMKKPSSPSILMARVMKRQKKQQAKENEGQIKSQIPIYFDPTQTVNAGISCRTVISFCTPLEGEMVENLGFVKKHYKKEKKIIVNCNDVRLPNQPVTGEITLSYSGLVMYSGPSKFISPTKPTDPTIKVGDLAFFIEKGIHYEGWVKQFNSQTVRLKHVVSCGEYIGKKTVAIIKP